MFSPKLAVYSFCFALAGSCATVEAGSGLGKEASKSEVAAWDIDIGPNGEGLPSGEGSVAAGRDVFEIRCAACHGQNGEGGLADRLAGGKGSLAGQKPLRTIGSYWPYAPIIFDYVRRAMPYGAPLSLTDQETYAVTAYLLNINGIVGPDFVANRDSLPKVKMPNKGGFIPPDNHND